MGQRALSFLHWGWLAAIFAVALLLRTCHLDYPALSIDEAESSVNAMTILQHGYPTDDYLGLPIYENTLVRPWPGGHAEYEFKDISYSDRGAAVYHGWLPLYAIAGSYCLAGIEPDDPADPPHVQTTPDDIWWRTVAARIPAVLFGALLIVIAYVTARVMAGREAGLIAATIAALAPPAVRVARDARYYAPTHALSLLCCLMVWLMATRGRWRDFIIGAAAFALLFHTHFITFGIALLAWLACLPIMLRRPRAPRKLAVFLGMVAVSILPWALASGFPGEARGAVPAARQLLVFPADYVQYLAQHWKLSVVLAASAIGLGGIYLLRGRLPARITGPFLEPRGALVLLTAWLVMGYVTFLLVVPAPSAFLWRLTLAAQGPGIVLIAILLAAAARTIGPRIAACAAIAIGLAMLMLPAVRQPLAAVPQWNQPVYGAIDYLRQQEFAPGTRIYATPLNHLTLTLLGGIPVQSTAPVHKKFFGDYNGEIVILETAYRGQHVSEDDVRAAASAAGIILSDGETRDWAWRLSTRQLREQLIERNTHPEPPLEEVPEFLGPLLAELRQRPPRREDDDGRWDNPAMFRGYETAEKWGFWQVFFYRFVDPASRSEANLNYADRVRGARAIVLDSTWVVFRAPPPAVPATQPAELTKEAAPMRRPAQPSFSSVPAE